MLKRSLVVLSLATILVVAATPIPRAHGIIMTDAEYLVLGATDTPQESASSENGGGNGVVKVLTAPFRAIGRVFGVGRKPDNRLHRLSEKDVKKFETSNSTKVVDARTVPPTDATPVTEASDGGVTTQSQLKGALARLNLERGRQLLNSGNFNEAIDVLQVATSQDPKLRDAYNLLGIAYESKGLRDLAFKSFEKALRGPKNDPEHLNNYGFLLFKNGDYDSAAKYLKKAVKVAPMNSRYWNNLGLVQVQREKFDDAYVCFEHAVGPFDGHLNIANRLQALGYDKDAIKHLELARAIQPNSREILVRLISLYKRTGRDEQAEEARGQFVALTSVASAQ